MIKNGNLFLSMGIIGYCCVVYVFQTNSLSDFFSVAVNYSVLALSSTALVLAALCENSLLSKFKIPGATLLATTSYAIYLTHKPIIYITQMLLSHWQLENSVPIMLVSSLLLSSLGGGLLYIAVERPFLKLRNKLGNMSALANPETNEKNLEIKQLSPVG